MQEEIKNFPDMVSNYYKKLGKNDMVFDFLHVNITYTYVDLNSRLLEIDSNGIPSFNNGKRVRSEKIFIPIVMNKNDYEKIFNDDEDYAKRTFNIDNTIDAGTSYNFGYDKIYKIIDESLPTECHIVTDAEVMTIANMNGYENIFWNIQNEADDILLKNYPLEFNWVTKVYGFKKLENEKIK